MEKKPLFQVERCEENTYVGDDTTTILPVAAQLPPHSSTKTLLLDILHLSLRHIERVVRNQRLRIAVVGVRSARFLIVVHLSAGMRQILVVPDAGLPRALADTLEGLSDAGRVGEGAAVERHAEDDLVRGYALANIYVDDGVRVERRACWARVGLVEVGLVAGGFVPATGVVIGLCC